MNNNIMPVYQPMKDAVKTTGLSEYYLRKLLKAGKLPHIKNGAKIFVNQPYGCCNRETGRQEGTDHRKGRQPYNQ